MLSIAEIPSVKKYFWYIEINNSVKSSFIK